MENFTKISKLHTNLPVRNVLHVAWKILHATWKFLQKFTKLHTNLPAWKIFKIFVKSYKKCLATCKFLQVYASSTRAWH